MRIAPQQAHPLFPGMDQLPPDVRVSTEPYEMRYRVNEEGEALL